MNGKILIKKINNMNEKLTDLVIPTFDDLIKTELQKYDDILPKVQELKDLFMNLEIASIEDKDGYAKVKEGLRFMVGKRTEIEDKRKELKADSLKFGKAVDERAKEIQSMISPIEDYLRLQKEKVDQEVKAIKDAEEAKAREIVTKRMERLVLMGFKLIDSEFVRSSKIDDTDIQTLNKLNVEAWSDDLFNNWCEDFYNDIVSSEEDLLKRLKEEEDKEKAELLSQQAKLKDEQAKFHQEQDEIRREKETMIKERVSMRIDKLCSMGLVVSNLSPFIFYENVSVTSIDEISLLNANDWSIKMTEIEHRIAEISKSFEEAKEIGRINAEIIAKAKIEKEQEELRLAEIERLSLLSDSDKFKHYVDHLLSFEPPEMKSVKFKKEIKAILEFLESKKS